MFLSITKHLAILCWLYYRHRESIVIVIKTDSKVLVGISKYSVNIEIFSFPKPKRGYFENCLSV